jgi:hypothetical protein
MEREVVDACLAGDLQRAAPESDPSIPVAADDSQTGELRAFAAPPGSAGNVPLHPSITDLRDLGDREDER